MLSSQIPVLLTNSPEARIFYRNLPSEEEPTIRPRKINLALIVDLSGSMDEKKRQSVQETVYSLVKSLINFRRTGELSYADRGGDFPIDIYYQIIGFGDSVEQLTEDTEEEKQNRIKRDTSKDLDQEIIKAVLAIGDISLGGTQDCLALKEVLSLIDDDHEFTARLENGEELLVVLEITDGETATPKESRELIEGLNSLPNVICRAIQIQGAISSEDLSEKEKTSQDKKPVLKPPLQAPPSTGIFENVWGDWGKRLDRLGDLKETMVAILYQALTCV